MPSQVVGEFNAGKSSVINALLGGRFLREGILPTTNEISVLRYGEQEETKQSTDGYYERFLPSELLQAINIVDTPGTNVILERQQRLTEEFVPRADLIMFVISADRPFTESEVSFLKYIEKWDKKVVYLLNKADILQPDEIAEVASFVQDNSARVMGGGVATVLPVSARAALQAKLRVSGVQETTGPGGFLRGGVTVAATPSPDALAADAQWSGSGFGAAEDWVFGFLGASQPGGGAGNVGSGNSPCTLSRSLDVSPATPVMRFFPKFK